MGNRSYAKTYDTLLQLKDAGAVGSSARAQVASADKIIDLGGGGQESEVAEVRGEVLIDVTALEIASNNEIYDIILQGSSDDDFSDKTKVVELAQLSLSCSEAKRSDADLDDGTGRYVLRFSNMHGGTRYRYVSLYTVVAGTVATGIDYTAYLAKD